MKEKIIQITIKGIGDNGNTDDLWVLTNEGNVYNYWKAQITGKAHWAKIELPEYLQGGEK